MLYQQPNEERFIHGVKPCGENAVELSRVGTDAPFPLGIVKEDWGWVTSRRRQQQAPQRRKPGSQCLAPHAGVPVAADRERSPGRVYTPVPLSSRGRVRIVSQQKPDRASAARRMTRPRPAAPRGALLEGSGTREGGVAAAHGHRAAIGSHRYRSPATAMRPWSFSEAGVARVGGGVGDMGVEPAPGRGWPGSR